MKADDYIKLFGELLVAGSLIFAIRRYGQEKKREFQKRFFDEQFRIYNEAVEITSKIAVLSKSDPGYRDSVNKFQVLFGGRMCIIEDRRVETRMTQFDRVLEIYERVTDEESERMIKVVLKHFSIVLAHTCRNSSISTWEVDYRMERFNNYTSQLEDDKKQIEYLQTLFP